MKKLVIIALAGTLLASAGCTRKDRIHLETEAAKAMVSDQEEAAIGLQFSNELTKQKVKYVTDPAVTGYVESITNRLFPLAEKDRKGIAWHVHVIDDPKTVNAFAVPGGHLFVYSGLLQAADDDAEIAGVLGHEMGHVVARHAARNMVDAFGLQAVAALALGQNPSLLQQLAANVAGTGVMLAHSRGEEAEADGYGVKYAHAAGFDPQGMADFFKKLEKTEGKEPAFAAYLSDHPLTPDRIKHVESIIAANHWQGGERSGTALAAIKTHLEMQPVSGH